MLVSDIQWALDNEDVALPTEVEVDDNLDGDAIADYLSDTYGFLVNSFSVPMTNEDRGYFGEFANKVERKYS